MRLKDRKYQQLLEQLMSLTEGEKDTISVMANMSSAIHETMGFWWTGFYLEKEGELRLGPFQGPVACMHIAHGKGVCGTAYEQRATIIVPDVEEFPGHIACSSESRSEIVVPVLAKDGSVRAVLDIDSREINRFDETDQEYLEKIVKLIP